MQMKLGEILEMKDPMVRLSNEKLPLKLAFKLAKVIKAIDEHLSSVNEVRQKLFTKLAVEKDGQMVVPDDKVQEFNEEWSELLNSDVDVDFEPISLDDLPEVELTAQDMLKLEAIFEA